MKSKTNKSGYVFLTKSEASAKEVLALTFTTYSYKFLTEHLHLWLNHLTEHSDAEILFERLDEILDDHSAIELMEPDRYMKGVGINRYARYVALFIFLLAVVHNSWTIYGEAIVQKKENAWEIDTAAEASLNLNYLIEDSDIQLVQQTLAEAIIRTTGSAYYQYFWNTIKRSKTTIDETMSRMRSDPDLVTHKNEMVLFFSLRCFIDSTFYFFGNRGNIHPDGSR